MLVPVAAPHPRILFCLVAFAMASRFSLVPFPPPCLGPSAQVIMDRQKPEARRWTLPCKGRALIRFLAKEASQFDRTLRPLLSVCRLAASTWDPYVGYLTVSGISGTPQPAQPRNSCNLRGSRLLSRVRDSGMAQLVVREMLSVSPRFPSIHLFLEADKQGCFWQMPK